MRTNVKELKKIESLKVKLNDKIVIIIKQKTTLKIWQRIFPNAVIIST